MKKSLIPILFISTVLLSGCETLASMDTMIYDATTSISSADHITGKRSFNFNSRAEQISKSDAMAKKILKDLYRANRRWRMAFIERVNALGIGEGALVEITGIPIGALSNPTQAFGHNRKGKHVGIIKGYDWGSLNFFCHFGGSFDYRSRASILAQVATTSGFLNIDIGKYIGDDLFLSRSFFPYYTRLTVSNPVKCQRDHGLMKKRYPV